MNAIKVILLSLFTLFSFQSVALAQLCHDITCGGGSSSPPTSLMGCAYVTNPNGEPVDGQTITFTLLDAHGDILGTATGQTYGTSGRANAILSNNPNAYGMRFVEDETGEKKTYPINLHAPCNATANFVVPTE